VFLARPHWAVIPFFRERIILFSFPYELSLSIYLFVDSYYSKQPNKTPTPIITISLQNNTCISK